MDASTRLYARLAEIPSEPSDPESLSELLVCAFGAFERYYICWKTQSGEYKQDSYDLPPALQEWLYPPDGTTRDFTTLQVVFGHGEDYFASDKDGKVEFKEVEQVAKPVDMEQQKIEKAARRRSRTVSFLRPLSEMNNLPDATAGSEVAESKRSSVSSALSRRASRPPSLSWSRTNSASSLWSSLGGGAAPLDTLMSPAEFESPLTAKGNGFAASGRGVEEAAEVYAVGTKQTTTPDLNRGSFQVPAGYMLVPIESANQEQPRPCTCGSGEHVQKDTRGAYVDAATQTVNAPSPSPRNLMWTEADSLEGYEYEDEDLFEDQLPTENPIFMGRMMTYFSKPGYQLGDSLASGYVPVHPLVDQYEDEYG